MEIIDTALASVCSFNTNNEDSYMTYICNAAGYSSQVDTFYGNYLSNSNKLLSHELAHTEQQI